MKTRTVYKYVEVIKQTLEELIEDNSQFLQWLKEFYGEDAKEYFINYLKTELSFVPKKGTKVEYPFVEVGEGSLSFIPYTFDTFSGRVKDPVNLIFYKNGDSATVFNKMTQTFNRQWYDVLHSSSKQSVYIDNASHGGGGMWKKMDYTVADIRSPEGFFRHRKHIRVFGSLIPCNHNPGFGQYSIASAHQDHRILHFLAPLDFDNSQLYVETAFKGLGCKTELCELQDRGEIINGRQHDGMATAIEI